MIFFDIDETKPDPAIFHLACEKSGQRPSECWYIGDNFKVDVQGSLAAGMMAIWLNRNGKAHSSGITTIESLSELGDKVHADRNAERHK